MFFIFDRNNPKVLLFYIAIILLGVLLEHFNILETQETVGIAVLCVIAVFSYNKFKS